MQTFIKIGAGVFELSCEQADKQADKQTERQTNAGRNITSKL